MKRSFAISSVAHIAFLTLVIVPGYHKVYHHGPEVINVKLIAEERPAPKPEAKVVPPKKEEVAPKKEPDKPKMTYKAPPKKETTPKKPETPKPKQTSEAKPKSTPAKTAGSSKSGPTSSVRVDDKDFRFGYYLEIVKERVSGNWSPPPVTGPAEGVTTTVYFRIQRDGKVSDVKVEKTSDFDLFDRSALRAVDLSSPLPPLPAGFRGKWLGVHFEFEHRSDKGL